MKWFSRRPFLALLVSMVLVSALPLLLNNLFYIRFRSTVQDQEEALAEESLRFSVQQIDRVLLELSTTEMQIESRTDGLTIPAEGMMTASDRMDLWEVRQELARELTYGSEYVASIYLYYPSRDFSVSDSAVSTGDMLYRNLYEKRGVSGEEVTRLHSTYTHGQLFALTDGTLAFAGSAGRRADGTSSKQIVLLLKPSFCTSLIDSANVEGGLFILQDASGTVLARSNKTGQTLDSETLSALDELSSSESFLLFGEQYRMFSLSSTVGGYRVRAVLPCSRILEGSSRMQQYFWVLLAASLGLGLVLAFFFSRGSVMPINELVLYIKTHYAGGSSEHEGLEQIRDAVDSLLDRQKTDQEELLEYKTALSRSLLRDTLRGNAADHAGFSLPENSSWVVICYTSPDSNPELLRSWVVRSFDFLHRDDVFSHAVILDDWVAEVMGSADGSFSESRVETLLTARISWLDQTGAPAVTAGFSCLHTDPADLERAYCEAGMALDCSDAQGEAVITGFSGCRLSISSILRDWHHLDKQLLFSSAVHEARFSDAAEILPELFPAEFLEEFFPESDISKLHLSSLKFQFLHDTDGIRDYLKLSDSGWNQTLGELLYCRSHRQLYSIMDALLRMAEAEARDASGAHAESPDSRVSEIQSYIRKNYSDPLLSVSSVADAFGISANSLSQLFSRKSDQGVLDFIHAVRMEKAAALLRGSPERTIQEIATLSGYTSIMTFNRKFKSFYGQTPTEYRKGL